MAVATAPMPSPSTRLMTVDEFYDFVNLPENEAKTFDLVRGRVVEMSRPKIPHGVVSIRIASKLMAYSESVGNGYVVSESGLITERDPDTVRGPDVAFYDDAKHFDDLVEGWATTPPKLAVEVRSPGESSRQLLARIDEFLAMGVPTVWLVDYEEQFVTVYRTDKKPVTYDNGDLLTCPEMPGFTCPVSEFFRLPADKKSS